MGWSFAQGNVGAKIVEAGDGWADETYMLLWCLNLQVNLPRAQSEVFIPGVPNPPYKVRCGGFMLREPYDIRSVREDVRVGDLAATQQMLADDLLLQQLTGVRSLCDCDVL